MVSGQLSTLLVDWTTAVTELDLVQVKYLLEKEPELLWTPIPHIIDDHLQRHLLHLNKLGSTFQPVNAIQFTCLFNQDQNEAQQRLNLVSYLIEQSSVYDLDTRFWGECNNTTLHLVCFLGDAPMVNLLIQKGVSLTPTNEMGYLPRDVTTVPGILDQLKKSSDLARQKSSVRPNYSTPDRFKLLRELAEETTQTVSKPLHITMDRKKSEGHYFKKGKVKETQQKVLTEEEVELEKQRQKRQLEVAQLAKKSAVKNNPLFKKLEKRAYPAPARKATVKAVESKQQEEEKDEEDEETATKRNSRTMSSLVTKSYVSSSIFVQADEDIPQTKRFSRAVIQDESSCATMNIDEAQGIITFTTEEEVDHESLDSDKESLHSDHESLHSDKESLHSDHESLYSQTKSVHSDDHDKASIYSQEDMVESLQISEPNVYYTLTLENDKYFSTDKTMDQTTEEESEEEEETIPVQLATRLVSPVYQPVTMMKEQEYPQTIVINNKNDVEPPVRPQRSDLRTANEGNKKRMSGSQKAAWTMSMSSWAAILDREFNLDELDPDKKYKEQQRIAQLEKQQQTFPNYRASSKLELDQDNHLFQQVSNRTSSLLGLVSNTSSLSLTSTLNSSRLSLKKPTLVTPQIEPLPKLDTKSIRRKPISTLLSPSDETLLSRRSSSLVNLASYSNQGKLYLHVNGIQDILLPLPKERAYVRCVVSDGRFEYMSRYEILSQNIVFDYECVIDTHPDMIITISLHVRPDYVMKSRLPFSRLFSSKKKKKECLSGYVHKEDGAIGQARFALAHMMPVCLETSYVAGFHCFNAWYSRSFKERHRQKKRADPDQDVLKVVGNFDVEMLYLPITDTSKPFPRNLRECDQAIKQLHQSVANKQ